MIDYIIGIGSVLIVIAVIGNFIKASKSGKGSCGCNCKGCSSRESCGENKK